MPQNPGAPAKKTNPLVWILGGVAVLMCGVMLTCAVGGYIAYRAVKNAGFDPDLMQRNPGLAMTKMAAALYPNLEVVSTNERTGKITMREKSTGKTMAFKFDPDKKTLVMSDEDGKEVKISASGNGANGSLTVETADGAVKYGAGSAQAPSWVPVYPGTSLTGTFSAEAKDGAQNSFTFKTKDPASQVVAFYQEQLKSGGFTVTQVTTDQGGLITGETADKRRTVTVTVGSSAEGAEGSLIAVEKK
jgi:VCBS repeat-containing protein